ncbi:MAG: hypothetical protein C0503_11860, partial [Gemmatimonas sp.]|nr:hypothetical protein [Gemmatimonas sp.]
MSGVEADQPRAQREPPERPLALHEVALATMAHGLLLWDETGRVELFNARFVEMYGLSPDVVRIGMSVQELLAHSAAVGNFPYITPEKAWRLLVERMAAGHAFGSQHAVQSGLMIAVKCSPMPGGRWVAVYEDVTEQHRLESALRLQAERTEQAITLMSHGLSMFDADERLIVANEAYYRLYELDRLVVKPGVTLREIVAHTIERGTDYGKPLEETYRERLQNARRLGVSTGQTLLKSGRIIEITSRLTSDGGWVSTHEDITDRRRYEDALREQNLRFDAALDNMAQGLVMFDADLRILVLNRHYLEMFKFDPEVVKPGASLMEVIRHSVEIGSYGPDAVAEDIHARYVRRLGGTAIFRRRIDDRRILLRSRGMANGGWLVTYEDVTKREQAATALREQNLRFDAALNNMSQGLCMFDEQHRLIVCNDRYMQIFGCDRRTIKPGMTLREVFEAGVADGLYPGLTVDELVRRRLASLRRDEPTVYDQEVAGGRTLSINICPMVNGGWVGTFEDITESRKLEAERAAALADLREQNLRFDAALNNMSQGLGMFDAQHRLIVCNENYLKIFRADRAVVRPGATMREIFQHG